MVAASGMSVSMLYKPNVFHQILNPLKLFQKPNLTCWLFRGAKQRNICFVPNLVGRIFSHKQSESVTKLLSLCRWELFWTASLLGHTDRWRCLTYGIGGRGCGHHHHHHHQHDQHHHHRHCHLHPHQPVAGCNASLWGCRKKNGICGLWIVGLQRKNIISKKISRSNLFL